MNSYGTFFVDYYTNYKRKFMKRFILFMIAFSMGVTLFGQGKSAADLRMTHSAYALLKSNFKSEQKKHLEPKSKDLRKIVGKRDFSRLSQFFDLQYFDGAFDTTFRVRFNYEGFSTLPDHSIEEFYSEGSFLPSSRVYYFYDNQQRDTMQITQYWDSFRNWTNSMRQTWRYDQMDNLHLHLYDFWDNADMAWILQFGSRSYHEYNANNQITSITYAEYYSNQWNPWGRVLIEYDSAGRHVVTVGQDWDELDSKWVNSWRDKYHFNAQNAWEMVEYYFWDEFSQTWDYEGRAIDITWLDFSELKWLTVTLQAWDGQSWLNFQKIFSDYNSAQQLLSTTTQGWDGTAWVNVERNRYEYDQYGFTTLEVTESWEGNTWIIIFGQRYEVIYDAYANPISIKTEYIDWSGSSWVPVSKLLLEWEIVTKAPQTKGMEFSIYPNPAQQFLKLQMPEKTANLEYAIFDQTSRIMLSGTILGETLNIEMLPPGIYVLQLRQSGLMAARKFIKR